MTLAIRSLTLIVLAGVAACGSTPAERGGSDAPAPVPGNAPQVGRYAIVGSTPSPFHLGDFGPVQVRFELGEPAPSSGITVFPATQPDGVLRFPATQVRFDPGETLSRPTTVVPIDIEEGLHVDFRVYLFDLLHGESSLEARLFDRTVAPPRVQEYFLDHDAKDVSEGRGVLGR